MKLLSDEGQACWYVAKVGGSNPLLRLVQSNIDMQTAVRIAMSQDASPGATAISVPLPIASTLALYLSSVPERWVSIKQVPV